MIGHLINGKGKKVAGPSITGSFDGVLTARMEDGSERKLWEKNWGPHGRDGRCVSCFPPWTDPLHQAGCLSSLDIKGCAWNFGRAFSCVAAASGLSQLRSTSIDCAPKCLQNI